MPKLLTLKPISIIILISWFCRFSTARGISSCLKSSPPKSGASSILKTLIKRL